MLTAGTGSVKFTKKQDLYLAIVGSMSDICNEAGNDKMKDSFDAKDPKITESPYSGNTLIDFKNNFIGLLENITESTILSFIDAGDKNGDGISGKANYVYDSYTQKTVLGRFGLKANTSSLLVQVASAYQQDMGVTSYVFPQESAYGQTQMNHVTNDGQPELIDSLINYVTYYVKTLAVPAHRNVLDATVKQGQALFNQVNCAGCHRPVMQTGIDLTLAQISNQRIQPYTDLLLHEMGAGLADNRPDYLATGAEWRTPPLWGIGLLEKLR